MKERYPYPKPEITLAAIQAIDQHSIAAGAYWFAGGARRIDQLLRQFGYLRQSPTAVEHAPDEEMSCALLRAVDLDSETGEDLVTVAILGRRFFSEICQPSTPLNDGDRRPDGRYLGSG